MSSHSSTDVISSATRWPHSTQKLNILETEFCHIFQIIKEFMIEPSSFKSDFKISANFLLVNLSTKCLKTTLSNSIGGWAPQASGWGIFRSSTKTFYRFTQSFLVVTRFRSNRVYLSSGECPSVNPSYTSFSNGRSINSFSSSVHFHHDTILCLFRSCSCRIIYNQRDIANSFCSRTCF